MDCLGFLRRIWPAEGFYCVAIPRGKGFRHVWSDTIEGAAQAIAEYSTTERALYHACASFLTKDSRKGANAQAVRSCWMDLDVEAGNPIKFESRAQAAAALKTFVLKHRLPTPLVVSSGGGIHAYFLYDDDVGVEAAREIAAQVKTLAIHDGFKIDPTRTADMASVLRPVGSLNFKFDPPARVAALNEGVATPFVAFAALVRTAYAALPVSALPARARKKPTANAEFDVPMDFPPADADAIADKCGQLRAFREARGNIQEPVWYAGLQVLHHCVGGDEKIHEWSQGHPDYTPEQTAAKIAQVAGFGPTSCETFHARNPSGCTQCPYRGKLTSPIQLGTIIRELPPPKRDTAGLAGPGGVGLAGVDTDDGDGEAVNFDTPEGWAPPPQGFSRTPNGIMTKNKDGILACIYPYDMFVSEIAMDDATKKEVCFIEHLLPKEKGWQRFGFRSSDVASDKDFERAMRDNHIKPRNTGALRTYVMRYMEQVQAAKTMRRLYASMGWKDGTDYFVLGERAYYKDGRIEAVGLSPTIASVAKGLHCKGDLQPWIDATTILERPGMEAHALMFGAGAGAPLMKFTGFEGALLNAVGQSNAGKTSMARFFLSMYGDFDALKLKQRDTDNAKIGRLGVMGSLPVYVDEVTNEVPQAVSDFVYEVTQGRSKLRLRIDGTERETHAWNTLVVSSSNASLAAKLGVNKANPDAERLRLFEFRLGRQPHFDPDTAKQLYRTCSENFGHAGVTYITYVVTHQDEIRAGLEAFTAKFSASAGGRGEERMWLASLCCTLYGLHIMSKLGLIRFSVEKLTLWTARQLRAARADLTDSRSDATEVLGQYVNEFAGNRITVRKMTERRDGTSDYSVDRLPPGPIYMRYDLASNVLMVQRQHYHAYLAKRQEDFGETTRELQDAGVLVGKRIAALGANTGVPTAATKVLVFDLSNAVASNAKMALVYSDEAIKRAETNPVRAGDGGANP